MSSADRPDISLEARRKTAAILRVLEESGRPLGGTKVARALRAAGIDLKQRMVRNYLEAADAAGLTVNLGRRGRQITSRGRQELSNAVAFDKLGFIDARADELAYQMTLDPVRHKGTLILNISTVPQGRLAEAKRIVARVMRAGLGMGRYGLVTEAGAELAGYHVAPNEAAIGTVCSITLNGLLRAAGVPVISRFGGLLEIRTGEPFRFAHIIHYNGTTLDPVEIFIRARMTSVLAVVESGSGLVGASFREVPAAALPQVEKVVRQMRRAGLGGLVVVGQPSRPLFDIPVGPSRTGIVVTAGLNPLAAVQEAGIPTSNRALARLYDFAALTALVAAPAEEE
ncbi:MAG: NrpR regulatory domain-containing protein [Phycisphaerae bacterium]|nr:NrpR regulatory domain-containing protein [Phycisphaerae bacterium]